ncbi:MAG: hypothetical protein WEC33_05060, partial [Dehalococcoidia bacterium]
GVYPIRWTDMAGLFVAYPSLMSGPFAPNLPAQAEFARGQGKDLWLTEMQAEPWEDRSLQELGGDEPQAFSTGDFEENIEIARRSGANRAYLWGAEWWYYRARYHGDGAYQDVAEELFR